MLIGSKHKIESDGGFNIVVYQRGKRKDGSDRWRTEAYFATVKNALIYLVDSGVRETGLREFKQVCKRQDELYSLIQRLNLADEPVEVSTGPGDETVIGCTRVPEEYRSCNTKAYGQNHAIENVTAKNNKQNVTNRIRALADKGMSSRAIAVLLREEGIKLSHTTVVRRLNYKGPVPVDNSLVHKASDGARM